MGGGVAELESFGCGDSVIYQAQRLPVREGRVLGKTGLSPG